MVHLTLLALHPAVAVLAVLAVVAPVPCEAVAVSLQRLAPVTVETAHPALTRGQVNTLINAATDAVIINVAQHYYLNQIFSCLEPFELCSVIYDTKKVVLVMTQFRSHTRRKHKMCVILTKNHY